MRIDASRTSTRARDTNAFQVRTIEGREAFVQVGEQRVQKGDVLRLADGQIATAGGRAGGSARSGVYVTARVRDGQVFLEVAPGVQSFASDGTRRSLSSATTLRTRLGEWITIAAVDTASSGDARGAAGRQTRTGTAGHVTQVRVTLLD